MLLKFFMSLNNNKYDYLLVLLISTLAFGDIGGALQIPRIMSLIRIHKVYFLMLFILIYSIFSLIWSLDKMNGLKEFLYTILHLALFLEVLVLSKLSNNALLSISRGWSLAVFLTLIVALWEIISGNHLSISAFQDKNVYESTEYGIILRNYGTTTFINFNNYITFLCYSLHFLYYNLF